jgi:hypothetical protein
MTRLADLPNPTTLTADDLKKYLGITTEQLDLCVRVNIGFRDCEYWGEWADERYEAYEQDVAWTREMQLGYACLFVGRWMQKHPEEVSS